MMHRDPDLLYAVRFLPCYLRVPGINCRGAVVACHSNWSADGKGRTLKAHDCRVAAGCEACHHELDFGSRLSGDEKKELWRAAHQRTMLELFLRGMVVVAGEWRKPVTDDAKAEAQQRDRAQEPLVRQRPPKRRRPSKTGHQNGHSTEAPSKIVRHPGREYPD